MKQEKYPKLAPILLTSFILASIGWIGLYFLILYTQPLLGPRWLFFFLLTVAVSGSVLPVAYFLNLRFPSIPPAGCCSFNSAKYMGWCFLRFNCLVTIRTGFESRSGNCISNRCPCHREPHQNVGT